MDDADRVSLIIPAYNAALFLEQAIRSALGQTISYAEIIVIDDGSSDNTADIARLFGDSVRLLQQSNRGVAAARNLGIEVAQNALLAFLDADDVMPAGRLEWQLSMFRRNPALEISLGQQVVFSADEWRPEIVAKQPARPALIPSALMCRASLFERYGPFDEQMHGPEFVAWFSRAMELGVEYVVSERTLVYRRVHDNNLSHTQIQASDYLLVVKQFLDRKRAA